MRRPTPEMRRPPAHALLLALLLLLQLPPEPADAWYKHAATPRFHTVGRAAGLLLGLRRAPPVWSRAVGPGAPAGEAAVAGPAARNARSAPGIPVAAVRSPRATAWTGPQQGRTSAEPAELPWTSPRAAVPLS
ncbi:neuropeptide W [Sorex araneus]|uniref:neuropeptide W n=1 Tax=Sorex araneus TaxID=42254 RepID=UPI0024333935|nr:neuropeptide W [Sorex araneus]